MQNPKVDAVFLDAGHTLLRPYPDVATRYANTAAKYGANLSVSDVGNRFPNIWRSFEEKRKRLLFRTDKEGTKRFWYEFVSNVFEPWMNEISDFDAFFEELYFSFASVDAWRLFDDVLPVLNKLKSVGVKLAIVSNWDYRLNNIIKNLGIDEFFDEVVISAEIGYEKPAVQIFDYALNSLKLADKNRVLHVGDSIGDDIEGAKNAGLQPVLIVRDPLQQPENPNDFIVIGSLYELFSICGIK